MLLRKDNNIYKIIDRLKDIEVYKLEIFSEGYCWTKLIECAENIPVLEDIQEPLADNLNSRIAVNQMKGL